MTTGPASSSTASSTAPATTATASATTVEPSTSAPPGTDASTSEPQAESSTGDPTGVLDTGPPGGGVLFDFFAEACGPAVTWLGYDMATSGFGTVTCGAGGEYGMVGTHAMLPLPGGGQAMNVIVAAPVPAAGSSLSVETDGMLPLTDAVDPRLELKLDCPDMAPPASFVWQANLLDLTLPMPEQVVDTVAEGVHQCGDPTVVVDEPLPNADLGVVIFMAIEDDLPAALAIFDAYVTSGG